MVKWSGKNIKCCTYMYMYNITIIDGTMVEGSTGEVLFVTQGEYLL